IENDVVLYTVLVDIANPDGKLMKDMTTQVFFLLGEAKDVVIVPVGAVREGADGKSYVTVITKDGTTSRRQVEVGLTNRISAEIKNGLDEGETVVTGTETSSKSSDSGPPDFF
ncbi:efflux RND transporter periplasmic adaptor subunit, partial [Parvibaculum sp.]|nr:efflux RND transporter periplasmic adaptor subunit [Parvibaculum sp.]